ncbi:AzlD domain-containing protein [Mesorhizobium sp. YR577]|uniref:AzlD domain-containing protein n=1 Tax=Mesorhizobium sp. YR577 TaxID=1884373 RepID=UPI0008EA55A8|nr:AzlD domain-containing protein [Mesorhizobium sp. YR577]SFU14772.1 Branched-chain amino acid transport protein (AzlD) [Mesorhizobium sp. YR577]
MTFGSIDAWWWPFLFILVAGWLATDAWRFLGVYFGGRISEESDVLVLVRTVATALVAAVIGNLIIFPSGELAGTPVSLRIGAAAIGFAAYMLLGRRVLVGIIAAELALLAGLYML